MAIHLSEKLQHLVNDRQAFERVFKQIYQIAFDMVHNHQDAEDLVQQSLLKGLESECVVDEHYQLTIGLGQIVRNLACDLFRHRQRCPHVALAEELTPQLPTPFETILNAQIDGARIFASLPTLLTATEAEVVRCYYEHGWSCQQIAKLFKKTPASIRQLHCRALLKLRNHFIPDLGDEAEAPKTGRHSGRLLRSVAGWESH